MKFTSKLSWVWDVFKARELKQPKRVTHSLSQCFLGRTGDTVQINNWNWTQSARHLYLTELSFLKSLLKRLTYFESKHKYLSNIRKNFKFHLWRYRTFSKGPFPPFSSEKNEYAKWQFINFVLEYIESCTNASSFLQMKSVPNDMPV